MSFIMSAPDIGIIYFSFNIILSVKKHIIVNIYYTTLYTFTKILK
jgi:hypothetical protein